MEAPPLQAAVTIISTGAVKGAQAGRMKAQPRVQERLKQAVSRMTRRQPVASAQRPQHQLPAMPTTADTTPTDVMKVWLRFSTRS